MKVALGVRELNWGEQIVELRDCNSLLGNAAALRDRMAQDGYLLVRGLHSRENVLAARKAICDYIRPAIAADGPGELLDARIKPSVTPPPTMGRRDITHDSAVCNVLEGKAVYDLFNRYFGEPALTFDYKWLRAVGQGESTGAHYDVVYMGRGTTRNLFTCWTPIGDVPIEQGTLAVCVGSHNLPGFEKLRQTYGRMDVDRDRVSGWYSKDPLEVTDRFGGQWATTHFAAGDVILFGMYTLHASTNNTTDRWRISCDTRFQPASEPVDERWAGKNPLGHAVTLPESEKRG